MGFLIAFEYMAVATVMPDVADDLDGIRLYAVGFAAPLAVSVIGYVLAGAWADRSGPRPALAAGIAVFSTGLVLCGLAPTMLVFVLGRGVQGLGSGIVGVAIYVVVATAYPDDLRPRVFTVLTAAWILPALVGPVMAAGVADTVGWRWVFLGVPVIAVLSWLMVGDAPSQPGDGVPSGTGVRLAWAGVAAVGVLLVSLAGQRDLPAWPAFLAAALAVVLVAGPRLLPPGTWTGRRGLASIVATRGLIAAAFAGAEAYVPLLLTLDRGLSLTAAGWVLTVGAVTWSGAAWAAVNLRFLADETFRVVLGAAVMTVGIAILAASVAGGPIAVPVVGWAIAGAGIGTAFSTISVLTLRAAEPGGEGRASSALQLNDSLVQAAALALGSALFAGFAHDAPVGGATLLISLAAVVGVVSLVPATRMGVRA
nr:MFS transporter [Nocardioides sp. KC13]